MHINFNISRKGLERLVLMLQINLHFFLSDQNERVVFTCGILQLASSFVAPDEIPAVRVVDAIFLHDSGHIGFCAYCVNVWRANFVLPDSPRVTPSKFLSRPPFRGPRLDIAVTIRTASKYTSLLLELNVS